MTIRIDARVTEEEVQEQILKLMSDGHARTNAQLKRHLRDILPLSAADRARANCRPNEEKWEELVNNALSPSRSNSLPAKGFTKTIRRGEHMITETGLKEFERSKRDSGALDKIIDEIFAADKSWSQIAPN